MYFKIYVGFGGDRNISIDESELDKAMYTFIAQKRAILGGEAIDGKIIQQIKPDYNRALGWNDDYKPSGEDFSYISPLRREYEDALAESEGRVRSLIESGQVDLIGKSEDQKQLS